MVSFFSLNLDILTLVAYIIIISLSLFMNI